MPSRNFIKQVGPTKWAWRYFVRQFRKRVLKKGVSMKLPTGLTYYAPRWDPSASEVYVTDADMDWGSEKLLSQVLDKEGIFIDVGAHTGYYSLYMLPLVSWVYAFEPDAQSYEMLQRYSTQYKNLLTYRAAVSKQSGIMEIQVKGSGFSFIKDTSTAAFSPINDNHEQIEVITLDDYIDDYQSSVTGIKIDVDGPDLDVLEGAIQTIIKYQPTILIELSSKQLDRLSLICSKIDYSIYYFLRNEGARGSTLYELKDHHNKPLYIKMLFLVPRGKKYIFDNIAHDNNSYRV